MKKRIGLVGARGYVGEELIPMIERHPRLELGFVSSRARDGERVADHVPGFQGDLRYREIALDALAVEPVDAYVLALPNGKAAACMASITRRDDQPRVVDLSADYRFDDGWYYGLPELTRKDYRGQRHISNPGCYASAMQFAIAPLRDQLAGPVQCFGVSGWSGAGTTPSDKNNPQLLQDNLMPYALTGHLHEREVSRHCAEVEFIPHVAGYFRGLSITANLHLRQTMTREEVVQAYRAFYADEPLLEVVEEMPWVSRIAGRHAARVGGFGLSADGRRLVVVSVLDNLLKGAATQAMQNLNLAFGFDEFEGITLEEAA
ncbi:N-acetyl-gamma-glutamyl-phosphate reductase [Luteimonas sp. e5]